MVNFKAAGHQGERKRSAALSASASASSVSKNENRHLLERPWSNSDPLCRSVVNSDGIALVVVARERLVPETNATLKLALVDAATSAHLRGHPTSPTSPAWVARPGGDFILEARPHPLAGDGEILLGEAQRLSLRVCEGEVYEWVPFTNASHPTHPEDHPEDHLNGDVNLEGDLQSESEGSGCNPSPTPPPPLPELRTLGVEVQLLDPPPPESARVEV